LPAESVAAAEAAARAASPAEPWIEASRMLLVVDVTGIAAQDLSALLGLPAFEAGLRARVGGLHLHRVGDGDEIAAEAHRLQSHGLAALRLPEAEARTAPVVVTGGQQDGLRLRLRTSLGPLEVAAADVMLVVEGPIQREYQSRQVERKKPRTATLDAGYRFHLHRRHDTRPVELDPASFSFGTRGTVAGSSLLELKAWIAALGDVAGDDGFRRLPVALAPAMPVEGAAASLRRTGGGSGRDKGANTILDNLAQFRFYSGWRAAAFRRR
jgi:hypothetical protein